MDEDDKCVEKEIDWVFDNQEGGSSYDPLAIDLKCEVTEEDDSYDDDDDELEIEDVCNDVVEIEDDDDNDNVIKNNDNAKQIEDETNAESQLQDKNLRISTGIPISLKTEQQDFDSGYSDENGIHISESSNVESILPDYDAPSIDYIKLEEEEDIINNIKRIIKKEYEEQPRENDCVDKESGNFHSEYIVKSEYNGCDDERLTEERYSQLHQFTSDDPLIEKSVSLPFQPQLTGSLPQLQYQQSINTTNNETQQMINVLNSNMLLKLSSTNNQSHHTAKVPGKHNSQTKFVSIAPKGPIPEFVYRCNYTTSPPTSLKRKPILNPEPPAPKQRVVVGDTNLISPPQSSQVLNNTVPSLQVMHETSQLPQQQMFNNAQKLPEERENKECGLRPLQEQDRIVKNAKQTMQQNSKLSRLLALTAAKTRMNRKYVAIAPKDPLHVYPEPMAHLEKQSKPVENEHDQKTLIDNDQVDETVDSIEVQKAQHLNQNCEVIINKSVPQIFSTLSQNSQLINSIPQNTASVSSLLQNSQLNNGVQTTQPFNSVNHHVVVDAAAQQLVNGLVQQPQQQIVNSSISYQPVSQKMDNSLQTRQNLINSIAQQLQLSGVPLQEQQQLINTITQQLMNSVPQEPLIDPGSQETNPVSQLQPQQLFNSGLQLINNVSQLPQQQFMNSGSQLTSHVSQQPQQQLVNSVINSFSQQPQQTLINSTTQQQFINSVSQQTQHLITNIAPSSQQQQPQQQLVNSVINSVSQQPQQTFINSAPQQQFINSVSQQTQQHLITNVAPSSQQQQPQQQLVNSVINSVSQQPQQTLINRAPQQQFINSVSQQTQHLITIAPSSQHPQQQLVNSVINSVSQQPQQTLINSAPQQQFINSVSQQTQQHLITDLAPSSRQQQPQQQLVSSVINSVSQQPQQTLINSAPQQQFINSVSQQTQHLITNLTPSSQQQQLINSVINSVSQQPQQTLINNTPQQQFINSVSQQTQQNLITNLPPSSQQQLISSVSQNQLIGTVVQPPQPQFINSVPQHLITSLPQSLQQQLFGNVSQKQLIRSLTKAYKSKLMSSFDKRPLRPLRQLKPHPSKEVVTPETCSKNQIDDSLQVKPKVSAAQTSVNSVPETIYAVPQDSNAQSFYYTLIPPSTQTQQCTVDNNASPQSVQQDPSQGATPCDGGMLLKITNNHSVNRLNLAELDAANASPMAAPEDDGVQQQMDVGDADTKYTPSVVKTECVEVSSDSSNSSQCDAYATKSFEQTNLEQNSDCNTSKDDPEGEYSRVFIKGKEYYMCRVTNDRTLREKWTWSEEKKQKHSQRMKEMWRKKKENQSRKIKIIGSKRLRKKRIQTSQCPEN